MLEDLKNSVEAKMPIKNSKTPSQGRVSGLELGELGVVPKGGPQYESLRG